MRVKSLIVLRSPPTSPFFFFNDTATTEIYTLSLHDALPISPTPWSTQCLRCLGHHKIRGKDRKSTRLNSSHLVISYAVFCLKKKKKTARYDYYKDQDGTYHKQFYARYGS